MKYTLPLLLSSCLLLNACASETEKKPLAGERISILDLQRDLSPNSVSDQAQNVSELNIDIPPALNNEDWPQTGGYPHHAMQNLAVGSEAPLEEIWSSSIGKGGTNRIPLNAKPIVADGHVFTLDAGSKIRAFHNQTGKLIWQQSIKSLKENDPVIGGGIAYSGGVIFATSGYDEVLALNPDNGAIYWRTKISAGSRAAPTIMNGRVFVTAMNNNAIALDASNGKIIWEHEGVGETTGLLGAASPAANEQMAVFAFSSGDLAALRVENGAVVWEDSLANSLRLGGMEGLSDIRGLPIIAGDRVIAVSFGNKMMAFDKNTGGRLWQKEISSAETPWVSGNVVYTLTSDFKIVAMDVTNGDVVWISELKKYENSKKREDLISWTGPIMINNQLLIAGTGGRVIMLDPTSGAEIKKWDAGNTISLAPIAAGGTLYILTDDGELSAYR